MFRKHINFRNPIHHPLMLPPGISTTRIIVAIIIIIIITQFIGELSTEHVNDIL